MYATLQGHENVWGLSARGYTTLQGHENVWGLSARRLQVPIDPLSMHNSATGELTHPVRESSHSFTLEETPSDMFCSPDNDFVSRIGDNTHFYGSEYFGSWQKFNIPSSCAEAENSMWGHLSEANIRGNALIEKCCNSSWFGNSLTCVDNCVLHNNTRTSMQLLQSIDVSNVSTVYIYIDGSSQNVGGEPVMSWSIACFATDELLNHDLIFVSGGTVPNTPGQFGFVEVLPCDAFSAEAFANLMARLWVMQAPMCIKQCVNVICYDSISASDLVQGQVKSVRSPLFSNMCTAVHRVCSNITQLSSHHIHSHCGHPWNELADVLANHFCHSPHLAPMVVYPFDSWGGYDIFRSI